MQSATGNLLAVLFPRDASFSRRVTFPVVALISFIGLSLFALLFWAAETQDRLAQANQRALVEAGVQDWRNQVMEHVQGNASNDRLYRWITQEVDSEEFDASMAAWARVSPFLDLAAILDPNNRLLFAVKDKQRVSDFKIQDFTPGFSSLMTRARAKRQFEDRVVTHIVRYRGEPYYLYIARLMPATREVSPQGSNHVLVFGTRINERVLSRIQKNYRLPELQLNPARVERHRDQIELRGLDGSVAARFTWPKPEPGFESLRQAAPFAAAIFLAGCILTLLILSSIGRAAKDLQSSEKRASYLAQHDGLTELANRNRLLNELARMGATGRSVAVLYVDLDGFKEINDSLGHLVGDLLLVKVARLLSDLAPPPAVIGRLGGDEFAILLPDSEARCDEVAQSLAQTVLDRLRRPVDLGGPMVRVGASIGIALLNAANPSPTEAMRHADIAMYSAKRAGRGQWRRFEPALDQEIQRRKWLRTELERDLAKGLITPHFQPLVTLERTPRVIGVEALARWRHPQEGFIPPDEFIAVAEDYGLIGELGREILRASCREALPWRDLILSVNLSPVQFLQADLIQQVRDILEETGFPPERLQLEITERVLLRHFDDAKTTLDAFRAMGVRLALDDFGTGYSSLKYLDAFRFDVIKIDKGFVANLLHNTDVQAIVAAIVNLGRTINASVLAEGIETEQQAELLRAIGCDRAQGYLFGRPMPAAQLSVRLKQAQRDQAALAAG
jgi:diguanylate cyclase (GGDEF)-like protein